MKEFVTYLVKNLVDNPDNVDVQVIENENEIFIELRVAKEDIARVVGRGGKIINSLRTIAKVIGARFGRYVRLELIEPEQAAPQLQEAIQAVEQE